MMTFASGGEPRRELGHLFPYVADAITFALTGSNCLARFDIAADLYPSEYDATQIGQIFDNLARNAQQAMPAGGQIVITACNQEITAGAHAVLLPGFYVRISVSDSGPGIADEDLPKIFDPFFSTKAEGHGLGLASSYSIAKRHGGCIDAENLAGGGAVFHAWLPAALNGNVPAQATEQTESPTAQTAAGTVLIMDDEEIVVETMSAILQSLGYAVTATNNGKEALAAELSARMSQKPFAAIILDLTIPGGMGGKEVVAEIRKMDTQTPIFVSSGYSEGAIMSNPVAFGFTAALPKPVRIADVTALLSKYLTAS